MFGYACEETPELMPLPIVLAHGLTRRLDEAREIRSSTASQARWQGSGGGALRRRQAGGRGTLVTIAVPHNEKITLEQVRQDVYDAIITPVLKKYEFDLPADDNIIVNGTGVWHTPGPSSDAGLTGRKIVVDSYGGYARVGGGAFSGKDPSKVDRSGAYAARYIAKNIVAKGLARQAPKSALAYVHRRQRAA